MLLLLSLIWACGGDGGPADPSDVPEIEDSWGWAFAESYADAAHTVSCINEGELTFHQTDATFAGLGAQTGTCQTPSGPLDNSGQAEITGRVSPTEVTFSFGGCQYRGSMFGSPIDSLAGTVVCRATIENEDLRLDGTWFALKGEREAPTATATLQPPEGDFLFVPQDQLRLVLTAQDDRKLRWVGYRLGPPASFQDSVAVTQKSFEGSFQLPIPGGWVGESQLTVFARDAFGRLGETPADQPLQVYDLVRRPLHSLALGAAVADVVHDAKRGKLYLLEPQEGQVQVLRLSDYGFDAPIPVPTALPGGVTSGADLTPSGDSLVFTVTDPPVLHFLNLVTGTTSDEAIVQPGAQELNLHDVEVAAGRAFVYGSFRAADFFVNYALWEFNLASKAQQRRLDAGGAGGNLGGSTELAASPDGGRLLLMDVNLGCMQLYTLATGFGSCVAPQTGPDYLPSGSRDGSAWLIRHLLYDGALNLIGTPAAAGSPPGVITPNADLAYYPTALGYDVVEVPSGVVREHVRVPYPVSRLTLLPDIQRLVVWSGASLGSIDRITIMELD